MVSSAFFSRSWAEIITKHTWSLFSILGTLRERYKVILSNGKQSMSVFTILVIFLQHRNYHTIFGIKDFQSVKTHCNERKAWNNGSGLLYCTLPYCKCLTLALDGPFLESPGALRTEKYKRYINILLLLLLFIIDHENFFATDIMYIVCLWHFLEAYKYNRYAQSKLVNTFWVPICTFNPNKLILT